MCLYRSLHCVSELLCGNETFVKNTNVGRNRISVQKTWTQSIFKRSFTSSGNQYDWLFTHFIKWLAQELQTIIIVKEVWKIRESTRARERLCTGPAGERKLNSWQALSRTLQAFRAAERKCSLLKQNKKTAMHTQCLSSLVNIPAWRNHFKAVLVYLLSHSLWGKKKP